MKRITALIVTAAMMLGIAVSAASFSDTAEHWAADEIDKAYASGFIEGDGDGTFRPDDSVSRAEFIKMVAALTVAKYNETIPDELDDGEHWASKYYNFASKILVNKLTDADKIGNIVPGAISAENADLPISRWEMAYILSEVFTNVFGQTTDKAEYTDKTEIASTYPQKVSAAITNCVGLKISIGDENGYFNPSDNGTRAEAATLMNRVSAYMDEFAEYRRYQLFDKNTVTLKNVNSELQSNSEYISYDGQLRNVTIVGPSTKVGFSKTYKADQLAGFSKVDIYVPLRSGVSSDVNLFVRATNPWGGGGGGLPQTFTRIKPVFIRL